MERWIGVRGAAVLGSIVLALAAISFFRYAAEHALIEPRIRVTVGTLLGIGCLIAGEKLRQRYTVTANALSGGGLVISYAAFWAARVLYDLISMQIAFALMALTTAVGALLAVRYSSLLVAVLGLVGGFATPLLLSTGRDNPIGLFGYILLLDTGFLLVARRRGWSALMSVALAGTLLLEALWITQRMGERAGLGIGIVALFSAVFAIAAVKMPSSERPGWFRNQVASLLLPFAFALYFASRAQLGTQLVPLTLLLGLLSFSAGWLAEKDARAAWLPRSAATAVVAVVGVWLHSAELTARASWEAALCSAALGLVFQLRAELSKGASVPARAASMAQLGLLVLLLLAGLFGGASGAIPPWLTGWSLLSVWLILGARFPGQAYLAVIAAALLAIGLSGFRSAHLRDDELPGLKMYLGIELCIALAFSWLSQLRRRPQDHLAALVFPALLLVSFGFLRDIAPGDSASLLLGATWAFGALALFAATRSGDARLLTAAATLAFAQHVIVFQLNLTQSDARAALPFLIATLLFVSAWPLAVHTPLSHPRWAPYTSALAGPAWFLALRHTYVQCFGNATIGLLPVALGALALAILAFIRSAGPHEPETQRSATAWYAAVALGFLSVAIPLQLERQWITVGWALESAAVMYLFKRLDHAGLKWLGLGLASLVAVRLVLNPSVLEYAERGDLPFLNWLLYTYWVPALALLSAHRALIGIEVARLRRWERELFRDAPVGALGLGVAVIAIVFVWLNLSIFDAFGAGSELVLDWERRPTRDLVLSLSWAAYAGVLLAIGMVNRSRGLRWISLALFILTIGKVFLYDLGNLEDLYQVLSLLGLALSLITVSLAYQRFVFGRKPAQEGA